ncbi:MAG: T9SS type A sorting domain-containing protein [Ignavibacteriae bacterium]|nr:T9SS type A sorting domain-containing protein [Ignavibacteriota bacterium]
MRNFITCIIAIIIPAIIPSYSQWSEVNNGFYGGLTTCFVYKDGFLFAGAEGSGIYRSSNNGSTWTVLRNGLPFMGTRAMIVAGANIFAGTNGGGVYITTNNGDNWSASNSGLTNQSVLSLIQKGLFIYAGTTNGGLYVSTNNGANWSLANSGLPNAGINEIINIGDSLYVATSSGVYLSSNNGASWVSRSNGLTSTDINSVTYDGTILYAASHTNGVFISMNKGDNWSNSSTGITNLSVLNLKNNVTKCFAGTNGGGVFYTPDGGVNWFPVNNGMYNTYVLKLFINGTNLYAGTDGGAFYTTDEGVIWNDITNGLTNSEVIHLTKDESNNMYTGTYGRGAFKSTNNGTSWFEINTGLEELYAYSLINQLNILFAGLWNGQVCRSTNMGGSWSTIVNKTVPRSMVWSFALIGSNLYHGNSLNGVYKSTDFGLTWNAVNNGLTNTNVRCLTANGTNLFAGTQGGGVYLSTNDGANWSQVNTGLPNLNVNCLTAGGANVYAGTSSNGICVSTNNGTSWLVLNNGMTSQARSIAVNGTSLIAATPNGIFYSTNSGTNWQAGNNGLLNLNCWSLLVNGTQIFLGTYGNGVFKANSSDFSGLGLTTITTGAVATQLCAGSTVMVPYTLTGTFNPGNTFTAQLSNSSGNFSLPTPIGSVTSTSSGTITCTIPPSIIPGTGFRIRVVGSNPSTIGTDNGSNISINQLPVPVINGPNTVCQNTSTTFSTLSSSGHSYLWEVNGGTITGSNNQSVVVINWTTSNPSGTVTLVETLDASGCSDSTSKLVAVNPSPNPVITGADTSCNRNTQIYNCAYNSGHSYLWSAIGGSVVSSANNSANIKWNTGNLYGVVSVSETIDATGCSSTSSKTVTLLQMPAATVLGTFDVCNKSYQNYSTTFSANDTYLWEVTGGTIIGNNNQVNASVYWNTSKPSGTVTLIETNSITLCKDTSLNIVNVYALPAPEITGTNLSYTDSVEEYSTTPVFGNSFKWYVKGGSIVGENNNIETKIRWLSPPSGTITLVQTVDSSGCIDSTIQIVTIKPFSPMFTGATKVCENTDVTYTASTVSGCTYNWIVTNGEILGESNLPTIRVHWLNRGTGFIYLFMRIETSGYQDSSLSNVTIYPMPPEPSITGANTSCLNKIENYSTPVVSGFSYKWEADGGFIVSDENLPNVQVRWLTEPSGTITVIKSIEGTGCSNSSYRTISVNPSPAQPKIQGAIETLNDADEHYSVSNNPGSIYKWYVTGGTITGQDDTYETDVHWGEGTSGNLKCIESNSSGCSDSNEITVALYITSVDDNFTSSNIRIKIIPNPINTSAIIEITSIEHLNADIQIVNSLGEIVEDFGKQSLNEGVQNIEWNGNDLNGRAISQGIYFIKLSGKFGISAKKIMVVK